MEQIGVDKIISENKGERERASRDHTYTGGQFKREPKLFQVLFGYRNKLNAAYARHRAQLDYIWYHNRLVQADQIEYANNTPKQKHRKNNIKRLRSENNMTGKDELRKSFSVADATVSS